MKKLLAILIASIITSTVSIGSNASILSPGMLILNEMDPMVMSGITNEPIAFSNEDFCKHTGVVYYDNLKITDLPDSSEGVLTVAGKELSEGEKISFGDCDRLVFSPADEVVSACFSFSIDDNYSIKCNVKLAEDFNYSPTALSTLTAIETFSGMSINGNMIASDPEGDPITYEITKYPDGDIKFNSKTGNFIYSSNSTGKDSFSFVAKDDWGNYSKEAKVELTVASNTTGISFMDMANSNAYAAAVNMIDEGIMTATETNGEVFFEPDTTVSRLNFLISVMNVMGASNIPEISHTDFADDSDIPDDAKGYVYSAEKLGIINGTKNTNDEISFFPNNPITKAEASTIINNIVGHSARSKYYFEDTVPTWAEESVSAMYELGIFTTDEGYINASKNITKEETAQLLERLKQLIF
ncbi:MAG: S-layer homology domain-containing protein [Clostridia bacterium]|nr:S-layer homology domain-containing protein [Clostridia bacterium]